MVTDTLVTRFVLDDKYSASARAATAATNQFASAQAKARAAGGGKGFGSLFEGLREDAGDAIQALTPLKALIASIVGVGVAGAVAGFGLMKQAAEFDSLKQSLLAVEGSAKDAKRALNDLQQLSKAPGLGFEEAVRGYTGLRNAGLGRAFAEEIIKEFANANARGGGNAETFGRILTQIRQAAGRQFLAQEDLTPIGEAGIPINKVLKDAFGTGDTEELKKQGITAQQALRGIVAQLASLKRVAGGQQNEFDNLGDAIKFAGNAAGDGLNQGLLPYFSLLAKGAQELTDSGVIQSGFTTIAENVKTILGDASDDAAQSMIPLIAGLVTASAGFRNLTGNIKGLGDLIASLEEKLRWIPGVAAARLIKSKLSSDENGVDTSLSGEYQRTVDDLTASLATTRKQRESREKRGLNPDGSIKTPLTDDTPKEDSVVTELKSIRAEIKRGNDILEDAASGGGSLVNARMATQQIESVTGNYNRRFRRMGQ